MFDTLKELCEIVGVSGREEQVAKAVYERLPAGCTVTEDPVGNMLVSKKGRKTPELPILLSAHMDEVGFIITFIEEDGLLRFATVGGIDTKVLIGKRVVLENGCIGVIGAKPIHLQSGDERGKEPKVESLYIDIGAASREEAEGQVALGDVCTFENQFAELGEHRIRSRAIDDRFGVALLLDLLKKELPVDATFLFCTQEEVGTRGATVGAFTAAPGISLVFESTTAMDLPDVPEAKTICRLGNGVAVSFMDRSTIYDKGLYQLALETAKEREIPCQAKAGTTGGNDAGAIHKSRGGVRTLALSIPCRYLHSAVCVADKRDMESARDLAFALLEKLGEGIL